MLQICLTIKSSYGKQINCANRLWVGFFFGFLLFCFFFWKNDIDHNKYILLFYLEEKRKESKRRNVNAQKVVDLTERMAANFIVYLNIYREITIKLWMIITIINRQFATLSPVRGEGEEMGGRSPLQQRLDSGLLVLLPRFC